jgi:hypothetical protein
MSKNHGTPNPGRTDSGTPVKNPDDWKPVFSYLEQEIKVIASFATVTGAVAAWWLRSMLTPGSPSGSVLARWAAGLLTTSAFLLLLDEARLSKRYGDLARCVAKREEIGDNLMNDLVRNHKELGANKQWLPYYASRVLLYAVGAILLVMLYRGSQ